MKISRRDFCSSVASAALLGCTAKTHPPLPEGELLGASAELGHRLRDGPAFPEPTQSIRVASLIMGGGVAGLSCAWWLQKQGYQDFAVLELESTVGGNARGGGNATTRYPWGAHYLPLPGQDAVYVRLLLAELGVLKGDPLAVRPEYDERYLCHTPQDRLFINGHWQDGVVPVFGVNDADIAQYRRFDAAMNRFKALRGADGRWAFTIPAALSSRDPQLLALDQMSMYDWLVLNGYTAPTLHWYANYACRDDFGSDYHIVSAWAGIHYFAGRRGMAANASDETDLTWPEGNAWLTERMAQPLGDKVRTGQMVFRIASDARQVTVDAWLPREQRSVRYVAERAVWAAQAGFLRHVWPDMPAAWREAAQSISYAPWLTANLALREHPPQTGNIPLSWDNIIYDSPALGYVVATHQHIRQREQPTVFTYYRALHEASPRTGRQRLMETSREQWAQEILAELSLVHPDIRRLCTRLDVWRWGHAMAQPRARWLHGPQRALLQKPQPRLMMAHADLSGFSLFEEANYWGVQAANWLMGRLRNGKFDHEL